MHGIVLCGGQSSRMGTDKGMLMLQSLHWAEIAADKFKLLHLPYVVSVNAQQYEDYSRVFADQQLLKDDTDIPVKGPLLGILSTHQVLPTTDLFVLACDMPLMEPALMQSLLSLYAKNKPEACVFAGQEDVEPLCAIYSAKALSKINQLVANGRLPRFSIKYVLENLQVVSLPILPEQEKCFTNFNIPSQLDML